MDPADDVELRPGFGRVLTYGTWLVCAATVVATVLDDPVEGLRVAAPAALVSLVVWALFGRPAVVVTPAGVELRNVLRTVELPWPTIQLVDTRFALTLRTAYGTYAAWAAPAPSRSTALRAGPGDLAEVPGSARGAGGAVRPGDLPSTPSGEAALVVRRRWEQLRDAGHLDDPRLERERPRVRWHVRTLAAVAVLSALTWVALSA
ncbi:PH domain-containing protein [Cellulomonas cellasea]|uniref:Low molecular weight protein antigen 6 PH domain-containing protein n=1 Tax=Cellulomonas cellasea TaxID=43670 RepID=A0A7W4UGQ8_9CELL|nr:PH domain-containing protein [Cellulomonas cellasea]MBB2923878.1 hypothetical protein [Cellulomonas cellasea]